MNLFFNVNLKFSHHYFIDAEIFNRFSKLKFLEDFI